MSSAAPVAEPPVVAAHARWVRILLPAWALAIIVWISWNPFGFGEAETNSARFLSRDAGMLLGNFLLFVPFSALLIRVHPTLSVSRVVAACGLLAGGLEVGQLYLPGRTPSIADVLAATLGSAMSVLAMQVYMERVGHMRLTRWPMRLLSAGIVAVLLYGGVVLERGFRLDGWDPLYGIAAGGDPGGGRLYAGDVDSASICAGRGDARVCAEHGAPRPLRDSLAAVAQRTQRLEIVAHVRSLTDRQQGPAGIMTFSQGASLSNVTVGQEGTALVLRFRTPLSGVHGGNLELRIPDAIRAEVPAKLTVRFSRGKVWTRVEEEGGRTRTYRHMFGPLLAGLLLGEASTITPAQAEMSRWLAAFIVVVPLVLVGVEVFRGEG